MTEYIEPHIYHRGNLASANPQDCLWCDHPEHDEVHGERIMLGKPKRPKETIHEEIAREALFWGVGALIVGVIVCLVVSAFV